MGGLARWGPLGRPQHVPEIVGKAIAASASRSTPLEVSLPRRVLVRPSQGQHITGGSCPACPTFDGFLRGAHRRRPSHGVSWSEPLQGPPYHAGPMLRFCDFCPIFTGRPLERADRSTRTVSRISHLGGSAGAFGGDLPHWNRVTFRMTRLRWPLLAASSLQP